MKNRTDATILVLCILTLAGLFFWLDSAKPQGITPAPGVNPARITALESRTNVWNQPYLITTNRLELLSLLANGTVAASGGDVATGNYGMRLSAGTSSNHYAVVHWGPFFGTTAGGGVGGVDLGLPWQVEGWGEIYNSAYGARTGFYVGGYSMTTGTMTGRGLVWGTDTNLTYFLQLHNGSSNIVATTTNALALPFASWHWLVSYNGSNSANLYAASSATYPQPTPILVLSVTNPACTGAAGTPSVGSAYNLHAFSHVWGPTNTAGNGRLFLRRVKHNLGE